jgi:hypothetical protein
MRVLNAAGGDGFRRREPGDDRRPGLAETRIK